MIGQRLKEERERLGMTQPMFAEAAGAAKRTLIEWEKGTTSPSAVQLSALHQIGVDVTYVLTGESADFRKAMRAGEQVSREQEQARAEENRVAERKAIDAVSMSQSQSNSATVGGKVTPLPLREENGLTQQEVLELVLDALHQLKRTLPAKAISAVVDAVMAWQRAGMAVDKVTVVEQLRRVK